MLAFRLLVIAGCIAVTATSAHAESRDCSGAVLNGCLDSAAFDGGVGYGTGSDAAASGGGGYATSNASASAWAFAHARAYASARVSIRGGHSGHGGHGGCGGGHR